MSDLKYTEKRKLEDLFGMAGGYVLDFSNRTFEEFVFEATDKKIYDDRYSYKGDSKANRLRAFWEIEDNNLVGRLLTEMIEYNGYDPTQQDNSLQQQCWNIASRLKEGAMVVDIDAINPNSNDKTFEDLAREVKRYIESDEPEKGLDRLHTFVTKYIRNLCKKRGITTGGDKPLHSLFGEYAKILSQEGLIKSEMTRRILKSSISTMEAFNKVRNEQSLAHDNEVLSYNESLLIFNHVASCIRFIGHLEGELAKLPSTSDE